MHASVHTVIYLRLYSYKHWCVRIHYLFIFPIPASADICICTCFLMDASKIKPEEDFFVIGISFSHSKIQSFTIFFSFLNRSFCLFKTILWIKNPLGISGSTSICFFTLYILGRSLFYFFVSFRSFLECVKSLVSSLNT